MTDFTKPMEVTDRDLAFPGQVIGKFLPPRDEIPKEFLDSLFGRWHFRVHSLCSRILPDLMGKIVYHLHAVTQWQPSAL